MTEIDIPEQAYELAAKAVEAYGLVASSDAYDIASDAIRAAAPQIERAVLEAIVGRRGDLPYDDWGSAIADRAVARLAELRAGQS